VYSVDLPGFGSSPINNKTNYDQKFFTNSLIDFINHLKLSDVTLAGESIGGVIPITIASKIPSKIKKIFCFNPYDYDTRFAEGIRRGNFFANFILFHVGLPFVGNFFSSLENRFILKNILEGGFYDKAELSSNYIDLLTTSLKKIGYVYHFRNVLSNFKTWTACKNIYDSVDLPIKLIYGEFDWSKESERIDTQVQLKLDSHITIKNCSHFSFLEKPDLVAKILLEN
tara:strand:- start:633 stop:1313 length:681 start_codon:yes stop_codon:yes gene_type:complete